MSSEGTVHYWKYKLNRLFFIFRKKLCTLCHQGKDVHCNKQGTFVCDWS